jgi:hypothetical protein
MNHYVDNRSVIKNLKINTGTSSSPVMTALCTISELNLNLDFEEKTWYDFCNSLQKAITTGVAMTIEGTCKIDINNVAIQNMLGKVHTLLSAGTISQFNNIESQFDLLSGVDNAVLEYTTYTVNANLTLESLGGSAEDEGEFSFKMTINGSTELSA